MTTRAGGSDEVSVRNLRTEFVVAPLGIEVRRPHLSWRIETERRGAGQSAYQIEVATSPEALLRGDFDLWNSGRVTSDITSARYDGATLVSRQRCYWQVRVWDERRAAATCSAPASWEMGLLETQDWTAHWLAAEDQVMRDDRAAGLVWLKGPVAEPGATTKYRLRFSTPKPAELRVFASAYGATGIWVDGKNLETERTTSVVLGPYPTTEFRIPVDAGSHCVAVALGAPDPRLSAFAFPTAEMAPFICIHQNDGGTWRITGDDWRSALCDVENWHSLDFDDSDWDLAAVVAEPRPALWPKHRPFLLRRAFTVIEPISSARIYATALGAYEIHLNGERVGDALLAPESTDFRKRALYRVYDVSDSIRVGPNAVGAIVGDGWYASYSVIVGRYPWGPPPRAILLQLELTYADGSREVIGSGDEWKIHRAPIVSSEIYDGEWYDARQEQVGWSEGAFDDSSWEAAEKATAPSLILSPQITPPIRRQKVLIACALTQPRPGIFVFDFGQNFAGWCRLRVTGPAGTFIQLRFAELLKSDGEVETSNLRTAHQTDTYIVKGDPAGESFEPHFTYHGFRYVQIQGFPGVPTLDVLRGIVIHSDLEVTGEVTTGSEVIDGLCRITLWSQRSNFMGIPTDCPQRDERLGWMGDANVFWDAAAFNMDVASFTHRFMADVRDSQADNGAFSEFSPACYRDPPGAGGAWESSRDRNNSEEDGAAPGWADAGVCLPWTVWQRYADTSIIEENWLAMARYLRFIADSNHDYIWRRGRGADYGDWLSLDGKSPGDATTPKDLLATAIWSHSVACMAEMAEATGRAQDVRNYRALWRNIASAFNTNFVTANGVVGNGSQTGYILALRYGLIPATLRAAAAANLVADIRRRGTLLSTGFVGTPNSLDVLADAGYSDVAYDLLLRTEFPSWGYMVTRGATTIWERWNSDTGDVSMNSFNHYALGAVAGFIFRRIAGIAPLEPGFRRIEVRPLLDGRLRSAGGVYKSVIGRIATRWRFEAGCGFELDLTVPVTSTAMVHLPAIPSTTVMEGGREVRSCPDIRGVSQLPDRTVVEVGSGRYKFAVLPAAGRITI